MSKSDQNGFWNFNIIDLITVVILAIGAIIADKAFNEYRNLNNISIETSLVNYDREVNSRLLDKCHLQSIFVIPPKITDPKERAYYQVNVCIEKLTPQIKIVWKNIPDLYNVLWGYDSFHDESKYYLRDIHNYCESIITIMLNAYWFRKGDYITIDSWETWLGYVREIGTHPIFLCVFYSYVKNGYVDKAFAEEIKKEILKIPGNRQIIKAIYEDMLEPDWIVRIRKQ